MQVYRSQWDCDRYFLHILVKEELNEGDLRIENFVSLKTLLEEIDGHKGCANQVYVRVEAFDWKEIGELAVLLRSRNLVTTLA